MRSHLFIIVILILVLGCSKGSWKVEMLASPAGKNASGPYLSAPGGVLWMSWIEQTDQGTILKSASRDNRWSQSRSIISGDDLLVNWADFPSILPLSNNSLAVHWLQKRGTEKYAYDVMSATSKDGGATWSRALRVHQDQTESEHGFASLAETDNDSFTIAWLDAGNYKATGAMSLRSSTFRNDQFENERLLDARVCDCCQTGIARIPGGTIVVYRDRSENEVRDIGFVRSMNGRWSSPKIIHADGWKINGCPVNGPAVSAINNSVAVAWYTGANNQPRVYVAFSKDAGSSFSDPIRVDSGNPSGRVDLELLEDGSAMVSWMENHQQEGADIRMRNIFPDGHSPPPFIVADTTNARSSGVPRMARTGNNIFLAWTFTSDPPQIRLARIFR